jgi:hypothetical protein
MSVPTKAEVAELLAISDRTLFTVPYDDAAFRKAFSNWSQAMIARDDSLNAYRLRRS